jgi:hypothetical protein
MSARAPDNRGAVLLLTFFMMLVLSGLVTAVGVYSHHSQLTARSQWLDRRALYIAESGWQRARQALAAGTWAGTVSPGNTYTESFGGGEYSVTVVASSSCASSCNYAITSSAYVPNQTSPLARRQVAESAVPVTVTLGTNFSLAATASASSSNGGNTPANAKDANSATRWEAGTNGAGSWLAMDYGSATSLNRIMVDEHANITNLTIEYSDNGTSWSAPAGLSVSNSSTTWTANFTPESHRYYRARFTGVPSGRKASVREMRSYTTSVSLSTGDVTSQW